MQKLASTASKSNSHVQVDTFANSLRHHTFSKQLQHDRGAIPYIVLCTFLYLVIIGFQSLFLPIATFSIALLAVLFTGVLSLYFFKINIINQNVLLVPVELFLVITQASLFVITMDTFWRKAQLVLPALDG